MRHMYKEVKRKREIAKRVSPTMEIYEAMCCPIPMEKIEEWIKSGSIKKVRLEAYRIKFA